MNKYIKVQPCHMYKAAENEWEVLTWKDVTFFIF